MTPLQKKKAAIIERIETAIDGIDGARDVIPGRYITVADLVIQLARSLMDSATTKSIDKIFADAVEDLPGTIENLNNIYGENPPLAPWPGNDITLLGNTYNHRQEEHGPPALFHPMTWFQPSFVGPDGEIPEAVPGDGYTLIGEDFLREVSVGQPLAPYYVHELAKAITAVEGPGYELQVTQGHSSCAPSGRPSSPSTFPTISPVRTAATSTGPSPASPRSMPSSSGTRRTRPTSGRRRERSSRRPSPRPPVRPASRWLHSDWTSSGRTPATR